MENHLPSIGVLGGMGPIASAEFVKTIYQQSIDVDERFSPNVILHSIAQVPDRTESIMTNQKCDFQIAFEQNISELSRQGIDQIIIACFTSHYFLGDVPYDVRSKVISIVDLLVDSIKENNRPTLLFATLGSYTTGLFKQMDRYEEIRDLLIIPDKSDWKSIHDLVYGHLKLGKCPGDVLNKMKTLMNKYGTDAFAAGCTEFHLVSKWIYEHEIPGFNITDPLMFAAKKIASQSALSLEPLGYHS